jgi:hypothetical protein
MVATSLQFAKKKKPKKPMVSLKAIKSNIPVLQDFDLIYM